ncbi:XRE family transcriptional regulator [Lachnospiraceae bacterium NSJ-143]|nr:XRE family transcriptional regulator [Lachnospiraceae bacterium NSJ-143]
MIYLYRSKDLVYRIKYRARQQKILIKDMLKECELSINTINQITDKKGVSSFSLAKIADCLDCSVDYLLGRTDNPDVNK